MSIYDLDKMKVGIGQILKGLEYHFNRYKQFSEKLYNIDYSNKLTSKKRKSQRIHNHIIYSDMNHEVIAYLNRMGQFYYFANSYEVGEKIKNVEELIPTIVKFIDFRHKQSAHRGTDKQRDGDNSFIMLQFNKVFSGDMVVRIEQNVVYQLFSGTTNSLQLDLLKEHSKIISEAEELLSKI